MNHIVKRWVLNVFMPIIGVFVLFGFVLPDLVSSNSSVAVAIGILATAVLIGGGIVWLLFFAKKGLSRLVEDSMLEFDLIYNYKEDDTQ